MFRKVFFLLLTVLLYQVNVLLPAAQPVTGLSLEKIMMGDEWIGHQPSNIRWSDDSRTIYFEWNPDNNPSDSLYRYDLESGSIEKLKPSERKALPPVNAVYDIKRERMLYTLNGDLHIRDVRTGETLQLTNTLQSVTSPSFTDDGKKISYISDNNLYLLDPETGELSHLDRQRDEAWIAGPGINIWGGSGSMGWMPDNRRIWFQSEETGYSHLYTLDVSNGNKQALTSGKFEVYNPRISHDKKSWYFSTNEVHPGERHFYSMPIDGGSRTKITEMEGRNDVTVSPDGRTLAVRYSFYNKPWELYVMDNKPGAGANQVTFSLSGEFNGYDWRIPELRTFTASDGEEVWARIYRPGNPEPGGPAVIFVHGAGYLQNAHKWWSSYLREYMFHNMLVDKGYTVMDIDFRASSGYGRDWRTGIYRHMGGRDLSDNVDGARFLVEKYGIDPGRIGIYGGSYGGFITLMAMFNHPDVFAAGAALRSVTDWAHYSHQYTSNILNTPVCDSLAYIRSSPIYFAEGLEGALLMCHGMVDDNVHFQDIVRLTQRLIELGKENWELAVYPVENHSFTETSSWVDEYRRILRLFENNLK